MTKLGLNALQDTIETVGRDRLPKLRALGDINLLVARIRSASYRVALTATGSQDDGDRPGCAGSATLPRNSYFKRIVTPPTAADTSAPTLAPLSWRITPLAFWS
jgi:hypothetical protein